MKFYLSSNKIGNEEKKLKEITRTGNKRVAYINNALDFMTDLERNNNSDAEDIADLEQLGFSVDILDLRKFFHDSKKLEEALDNYAMIWVRGGNTFVLAQAFKLSGLNEILTKYYNDDKDIVYGGYSAGICNIGTTLKGLHLADDPYLNPYKETDQTIWEGLNILDYALVPHYKSNYEEFKEIDRAIEYMIDNKIPFKALRDGEVIIIE